MLFRFQNRLSIHVSLKSISVLSIRLMIDIILFRICLWITYKAYNIQGTWLSIQVTLDFLEINIRSVKKGYRIDVILLPICLSRIYKVYLKRYIGSGFHAVSMIVIDMSDTRWPGPLKRSLTAFSRLGPALHCGTLGKSFAPQICVWPGPWKTPNWRTVSEAFWAISPPYSKGLTHL